MTIYLDHAATTPVIEPARAAIARGLAAWANPSSPHGPGRAARALLEEARAEIASALGWRHDVILTSGASEAVAIVAARARVAGRAYGATEHGIVGHAMGEGASVIAVGGDGLVDEAVLDAVLAAGPTLVAIQQVNNETGVIQPLDRIAASVRAAGSMLLADCAQGAGKIPLPDADFIALSAHKLGGPPGIGALLVRDLATLDAVGGQEKGYRRGTQDMVSALGFSEALAARPYDMARLLDLREKLDAGVVAAGGTIIAAAGPRLATIASYALPGASSAALLVQLDAAGIAVSAGSACSSGTMKPSEVLAAMGVDPALAGAAIRVSFGPASSDAEIDAFLAQFAAIAARARPQHVGQA